MRARSSDTKRSATFVLDAIVAPTPPAELGAVLSVLIGILATPFTGPTGLTVGPDSGEPTPIAAGDIAESGHPVGLTEICADCSSESS